MTKFFINKHKVESRDTLWSLAKYYGLKDPGAIYFFDNNLKQIEIKNKIPLLKIGKVIDIPFSERDLKLAKIFLNSIKSKLEHISKIDEAVQGIENQDELIDIGLLLFTHGSIKNQKKAWKGAVQVGLPSTQFVYSRIDPLKEEKENHLWLELMELLATNFPASKPTPLGAAVLGFAVVTDLISVFGRRKIKHLSSKSISQIIRLDRIVSSKFSNVECINDLKKSIKAKGKVADKLNYINYLLKNINGQLNLPYHIAKL